MSSEFDSRLDRSRIFERAWSNYLQKRGYLVLPAAEYRGWTGSHAPMLVSSNNELVLPDLLVARDGHSVWMEIKVKRCPSWYTRGKTFEIGLALRHWQDYLAVKKETGVPVYLVFVVEEHNMVSAIEVDSLKAITSHIYRGDSIDRGGTIFFDYAKLKKHMDVTTLHNYADEV